MLQMDTYGERLKAAMDAMTPKCSRARLARELGISIQAVGQLINGKTHKLNTFAHGEACRFLNVTDLWLSHGDGEMRPAGRAMSGSLSPDALRLAQWFDILTDEKARFMAYAGATQAIAAQMPHSGPPPKVEHIPPVRSEKAPAKRRDSRNSQ